MRIAIRLILAACVSMDCSRAVAEMQIDAAYPGGNVIVENIAGDIVRLRPDLRGTADWWFYWNFRVLGAPGKTLEFHFDGRSPLGARGPAVSADHGRTWSWLGIAAVDDRSTDASFRYTFPENADDVRFAFCPPYQEADLRRFLVRHAEQPELTQKTLCQTEKKRSVELLRIASTNRQPLARVLLTARHHACEAMASYTLEGLLAAVLKDDDTGRWLRERIEFVAIPFVDKDGVEEGDQGKNRAPHDHWLDYKATSRYASVAALRKLVSGWSDKPIRLAMDLHCSYLREAVDQPGCSERVFFMNSMVAEVAAESQRFQHALVSKRQGAIPYSGRQDLSFGVRWNTQEIAAPSFLGWSSNLPGIWVATVLEVPYANADGVAVTPDSARELGRDLALAMQTYFARKFAADGHNAKP